MTPRRTPVADGGVGRKSAWAQVGEDKVRTPKGRPLDCNMQMILVSEVREKSSALVPCVPIHYYQNTVLVEYMRLTVNRTPSPN